MQDIPFLVALAIGHLPYDTDIIIRIKMYTFLKRRIPHYVYYGSSLAVIGRFGPTKHVIDRQNTTVREIDEWYCMHKRVSRDCWSRAVNSLFFVCVSTHSYHVNILHPTHLSGTHYCHDCLGEKPRNQKSWTRRNKKFTLLRSWNQFGNI